MIQSRDDLKEYLEADRRNLGFKSSDLPLLGKEIWKFQISLRYLEYYTNVKVAWGGVFRSFWRIINRERVRS